MAARIDNFCRYSGGILIKLTSVEAGAIGAALLTYLSPLLLTPARLIATDIVHAIPLAFFGFGALIDGQC